MKDILALKFEEWITQIEASPLQKTTIDISKEFQEIMARNIITIAFGEDINSEKIDMNFRKEAGSSQFITKKVIFSDAIEECFNQLADTIPGKLFNPLC